MTIAILTHDRDAGPLAEIKRHRWTAALALLLQLGDAVSTHWGLSAGMREANLIPSRLLSAVGEHGLYSFKMVVLLVALSALCLVGRRYPLLWRGMQIANGVTALVVLLNVSQMLLGLY